METGIIVTGVAAGIAALSFVVTIVVLLVRGSFVLGSSVNQVNNLGRQVEDLTASVNELRAEMQQGHQQLRAEMQQGHQQLRAEMQQGHQQLRAEMQQGDQQLRAEMAAGFDKLADAINGLRDEVQQNNQMLAALANHTHDTDGRTVFTLPSIA